MTLPWIGMEIIEEIGSGAFGTVYLVEMDGKEYALKIIRIPQSDEEAETLARSLGSREEAAVYYEEIADGFTNEIRILHKFKNNPNIVNVLDYRIEDLEIGCEIYILMEALETFTEYEITHKLEEKDAIRLGTEICQALESCEKEKIVHRDLKPDNILVSEDGTFKICDFGVAKNLEKSVSSNSIKGTFTYMAPEVYHGKKYDHRADLYSLGLILYRMVNGGKEPFIPAEVRLAKFKDKEDALNRRMDGEALPVPAEASEGMAEIILKACAYYPGKRYQTASEMKEDLIRLRDGKYVLKNTRSGKYGKRKKGYYIKAAMAVAAVTMILAGTIGRYGINLYREKYVNYCDTEMQKKLMEKYKDKETDFGEYDEYQIKVKGCNLGARLDGNGVLYIESDDDMVFCDKQGEYPWADHKDRIKTIVFGEKVTTVLSEIDHDGEYLLEEAFGHLKNLEKIVIKGDKITIHGTGIFGDSNKLSQIEASPEADIKVEGMPFSGTPWEKKEKYQILGGNLIKYNGKKEVIDDIPQGVTKICREAFSSQDNITSFIIPDGVKQMEEYAFPLSYNLKKISIPSSLEMIDVSSLNDAVELEEIQLAEDNPYFRVTDGVLYDRDMTKLICCPKKKEGILIIPEGVREIVKDALNHCNQLTEIIFPKEFPAPEDVSFLFNACEQVKRISIPDSFNNISQYTFYGCSKLEELEISPDNQYYTFSDGILYDKDCKKLVFCIKGKKGSCRIKESVTIIEEYAFEDCMELTEIILPEGLVEINRSAFLGCEKLDKIIIPESVTRIDNAFWSYDRVMDIYYVGSEDKWKRITSDAEIDPENNIIIHYDYKE